MLTTSVLLSGLRAAEPDPALLDAVHASGTQIDTAGMAVLGGWAVVNIAGGGAGSLTADDPPAAGVPSGQRGVECRQPRHRWRRARQRSPPVRSAPAVAGAACRPR
jgi:hypothetical protein